MAEKRQARASARRVCAGVSWWTGPGATTSLELNSEALPPRDAGIFRLWLKLPIRVHRSLRTDPRASAYSATTHAGHRRPAPRPGPPPSVDRAVQRGTGSEDKGGGEGGDKFCENCWRYGRTADPHPDLPLGGGGVWGGDWGKALPMAERNSLPLQGEGWGGGGEALTYPTHGVIPAQAGIQGVKQARAPTFLRDADSPGFRPARE